MNFIKWMVISGALLIGGAQDVITRNWRKLMRKRDD